jgi:hypothetical protein
MTVAFLDRRNDQCCTPMSGDPGPRMEVCGAPVKPGTVYCSKHYHRFYVPVTRGTVRMVKETAIRSGRKQRMTVLSED